MLGGLSGVGKTTIAREARAVGAVRVRIDSIEQVLRRAGLPVEGEGYGVADVLAEDHLRLGRVVVADCVRGRSRAGNGGPSLSVPVYALDVEVVYSDVNELRRRVESRLADIVGPKPTKPISKTFCRPLNARHRPKSLSPRWGLWKE